MGNTYNIRDYIMNCDINEKQDTYIQPLNELSSYIAWNFFDYAVCFDTSTRFLKEIEKGNLTKEGFSKTLYTLYKFIQNKWETEFNNKDSIPINRSSFLIYIPETGINYSLCVDELFNSVRAFLYAFRKWSIEYESKWKKNIRDLSPYIETMFKELSFFKLQLYSTYLTDGSYDIKNIIFAGPNIDIRNIDGLVNIIKDFVGSINNVYNDIISISFLIKASINFSIPVNTTMQDKLFQLQNPDINIISQNKHIEEDDW